MAKSNDHVAIIEPDTRGRFNLRKFLGSVPDARYRVYVNDERSELTLERIEDEE